MSDAMTTLLTSWEEEQMNGSGGATIIRISSGQPHTRAIYSAVLDRYNALTGRPRPTEEDLKNLVGQKVTLVKHGENIHGPKVNAFYRAIMGDTQSLVLDRWAIYAAGHPKPRSEVPRAVRDELQTAYRAAAAAVGETVRAFQAIVWIVCRESTPTAKGFIPKLQDVTT